MNSLDRFKSVNEDLSVYRYTNGWMVHIAGHDYNLDSIHVKLICNTEEELHGLIDEYNTKEID